MSVSYSKIGMIIIGGVLGMILAVVGLNLKTKNAPSTSVAGPFILKEISEAVVATSFEHTQTYDVDPGSRILLVPHHLVAGREIASLISSASKPKHVLLLSPDHFAQGKQALAISDQSFLWKDQIIAPDTDLITRLQTALPTKLRLQNAVFIREHGVRGLLPFFAEAWPNVPVTALTVRVDTSTSTMQQLANTLHEELAHDPGLLVITTIDFSHELPAYIADLHDAQAIEHLQALDAAAFDKVEIDSPPLYFLLATLTGLEKSSLRLHAHTNSLKLMNALSSGHGTSHVLMSTVPNSTPTAINKRFTLFTDARLKVTSSEDRIYRGYDEIQQAYIPYSALFVREETPSEVIWHPISLTQNQQQKTWELAPDTVIEQELVERYQWKNWAATNLPTNVRE